MPIQVDVPTALASTEVFSSIGGNAVSCVIADDGDTSYIAGSFSNPPLTQSYVMPDLPGNASTVNSVQELVRARRTGTAGNSQVAALINGGTPVGGAELTLSYFSYATTWTANKTPAGVNAGVSGVQIFDTAGDDPRVTLIQRTTDYNLGAEIILTIFDWLLPLAGASLTLKGFAAANARVRQELRRWYRPDELAAAFAEWRAHRFPSRVFLNGGACAIR